MSELAFNLNGDPFDVPANAAGWRVRKMKTKGAPEVAYGRNGQPLVLPLEADVDDLRAEVGSPGRYRLDPVDETSKPIANAPAGYVMVHELAAAPAAAPASVVPLAPLPHPSENVVIEAMRMNAEIARAVVDRFPQVMEGAAILLRAADGAGLPARQPLMLEDASDDEDEDEEQLEPTAGFDLNALIAQIVPLVIAGLGSGKLKVPNLGAMFDWRKAAKPAASMASTPTPREPASVTEKPAAPKSTSTAAMAPLDPAAMAHVVAVQSALDPKEVAYIQQIAKELSPAELRGWFDELSKLSVPDAVARVRGLIARNDAKKGSAS